MISHLHDRGRIRHNSKPLNSELNQRSVMHFSTRDVYAIREVKTFDDFFLLKKIWNEMVYKEGSYAPFQSHEWFELWLNHFICSNEIFILLLYKEKRLVAIAPLLRVIETTGPFTVKKLELIGNAYSATRNFIFARSTLEDKQEYLSALCSWLDSHRGDWDILDLKGFSETDGGVDLLRCVLKKRHLVYAEKFSFENWHSRNIVQDGDGYINNLPSKTKSELRRRKKRLGELGKLDFKVIRESSEIDLWMDHYYEVYAKSWKKKEGLGPDFHRHFGRIAAEKGWLRLGFLFLDNKPIAVQFRIVYNDLCVFIKTAYDVKYKKYGPGTILLSEMIRYVIDVDRIRHIDFGPGGEPYKRSWADEKWEMMKVLAFSMSMKGRLLGIAETRVLPLVRRIESLNRLKSRLSSLLLKKKV